MCDFLLRLHFFCSEFPKGKRLMLLNLPLFRLCKRNTTAHRIKLNSTDAGLSESKACKQMSRQEPPEPSSLLSVSSRVNVFKAFFFIQQTSRGKRNKKRVGKRKKEYKTKILRRRNTERNTKSTQESSRAIRHSAERSREIVE